MTEVQLQEFKLEPNSELRFEVESKNEKVVLEVSSSKKRFKTNFTLKSSSIKLLQMYN